MHRLVGRAGPNVWAVVTSVDMATVVIVQAQASGFATYFAWVQGTGNVLKSSGVVSATKSDTGVYDIVFKRTIDYCGFVASVNGATAGYATTAPGANAKTVTVRTFASNGAAANRAFTVFIQCAC